MIPYNIQSASRNSKKPLFQGIKRFCKRKRSYLPVAIQKQLLKQSCTPEETIALLNELAPCSLGLLLVIRRDGIFLDEVFYTQQRLGILAGRILGRDKAFSERQVRRALVILKELKLVAVQSRKKHRGKHQTNIYAVANFFHLPEIKNALDKFVYHLKSFKVVSLSFLRSQGFSILRSSYGFWQNVLLNKLYVYNSLTLLTYRVTLCKLFTPKEEKVRPPQRESRNDCSFEDDLVCSREIESPEEETFLMEQLRKLQFKARQEKGASFPAPDNYFFSVS